MTSDFSKINKNTKKKKKKQVILLTSFLVLSSSAIIAVPAVLATNLTVSNPLQQVNDNIKLISAVNLKDEFVNNDSNYFTIKNKIFNSDGSKKTGVDFASFFDFYQNLPNYSGIIDFKNDVLWSKFKIEIFEIKAIDSEQSFEIYYRLLQDLGNNDIAKSDLYRTKVAYSLDNDYSLSRFANQAKTEIGKLRAWTNQEFSRSTKKRSTKLTLIDDFFAEINTAKTADEVIKILDQFFNYSEIVENLYKKAENQFENELGKLVPKIQVQLIQDPMFHQGFLTKTATENIYRLWFSVSFTPEFAKTIKQDFNADAKFQSFADLDFSNLFLNEKIKDAISLTPFSQQDYLNASNQVSQGRDAWNFMNYFKNQVFASKEEKQEFLDGLLKKITKKSLVDKLDFGNSLANLPKYQVLENLDISFEIDPDRVELVNQKDDVLLRVFGKAIISDPKKKFSVTKDFHQDYGNLGLLVKNDPIISEKVKTTKFDFKPKATKSPNLDSKKISKKELLELLQTGNHKKLKKILTNKRYYGFEFDETRLDFLVNNYELPTIEKLKSGTTDDFNLQRSEDEMGVINVFNPFVGKGEKTLQFLITLSNKDAKFVGKYFFEFLKYLKLINKDEKWPEDIDSHNFFEKMSKIKIIDIRENDRKDTWKKLWLFSFNGNYWTEGEGKLPYSFYLHKNFENIRKLVKTNDKSVDIDYYIDQIRQNARKIPEGEAKQDKSIDFENFADFLIAFYASVYANDKGLLTNTLGKNFGYQIEFEQEKKPVETLVSSIQTNENQKVKLHYFYKIGSLNENNQIVSNLFETEKGEIEINVSDNAAKYDDEIENLNDLVQNLPTASFPVYLSKVDFNNFNQKVNEEVKKIEPNVEKILKNIPFWEFFKLNYREYGLKIQKEKSSSETQTQNSSNGQDIKGVFETIDSISGETKKALYLHIFSKKNPEKVSNNKFKIIIKQENK